MSMKSQYNIYEDGATLELTERVRIAYEDGHRIVWNHNGMRGVIPPAILEAQFSLMRDYSARPRNCDRIPPGVGVVEWQVVVRIPSRR